MATAQKSLFSTCKEAVKCAICLKRLHIPRALACLHSYCEHCLVKVVGQKESVSCPICQRETPLPDEGVSGLALDFRVKNILEALEQDEPKATCPPTIRMCDVCTSNGSKSESQGRVYCLECGQVMCVQCATMHGRMSSAKDHTVTDVKGLLDGWDHQRYKVSEGGSQLGFATKCDQHEGSPFQYFCITCLKPICKECTKEDHSLEKRHEFKPIDAHVPTMRAEINKRLEQLKKKSEEFKAIQEIVDGILRGMVIQREKYEEKVNQAVGDVCERVRSQGEELIIYKKEQHEYKIDILKQLDIEAEKVKEVVLAAHTETLLMNCSHPVGLATSYNDIICKLDRKISDSNCHDSPSALIALNTLIDTLQATRPNYIDDEQNIWQSIFDLHKMTIPVSVETDLSTSRITFSQDGRLLMTVPYSTPNGPKGYHIKSTTCGFPACYKFVTKVDLGTGGYPLSIAAISANRLVMRHATKQLAIANERTGNIEKLQISQLIGYTLSEYGVSTDIADNIYITDRAYSGSYRIHVFNAEGGFLRSVVAPIYCDGSIQTFKCAPVKLVVYASNNIFVLSEEGTQISRLTKHKEWNSFRMACDQKYLYVLWTKAQTTVS